MNASPHAVDPTSRDLAAMQGELVRLRHDVDELRRENAALRTAAAEPPPHETSTAAASSRRTMLRLAGAAVVGAAAASVGGTDRAAAATDETVQAGWSHPADRPTSFRYGTGAKTQNSPFGGSPVPIVDVDGAGAANTVGVQAFGTQWGMLGIGTYAGVASYGLEYGFAAIVSTKADFKFGLLTGGTNAPKVAPAARTDAHLKGELDGDGAGNLWFCIADGTPGTWVKVAGPGASGRFTPVGPFRVYDSRVAAPSPGVIGNAQTRTISVADARNLDTGAVTSSDIVPAGATAISCNVGVVGTSSSGFVTVNPGGDTEVRSASINWFGPGQVLNNGIIVKVDSLRRITAIVGGGGSTDLVIDVTGYFE